MGSMCSMCFQPGSRDLERQEAAAKNAEVKARAGLAAQQRAELFEKSPAGKAARAQAAAAAARPSPPLNRGEPVLKWQMG